MIKKLTYLFVAVAMLSAACERTDDNILPMPEPDYSAPIAVGSAQVVDNQQNTPPIKIARVPV